MTTIAQALRARFGRGAAAMAARAASTSAPAPSSAPEVSETAAVIAELASKAEIAKPAELLGFRALTRVIEEPEADEKP
jgi:hypothetical protein